jgi:hypothetical protein
VDETYDLLQDIQADLENDSEEVEEVTGVDRRDFVFMSLVAAAATTFGVPAARAQAGSAPPQQPEIILGNGEPPSTVFQAYPGGTGALMEKLAKERGRAAFERATFTVAKWTGPVPTSDEEIAFLPAHRLSALIKERKITSARLTDIYLSRLKRFDPILLCAVTIMEEQARAAAQRADAEIAAGRYRGPLHGLPWGIKDLFSTKGVRTTWGSRDFENRIIDEDAEVVVRLRDAGAVLIAKLSTGLFANNDWWYRGRTNNPWDIRRGSSGSSAGPASATAAGCVAFAIGTETSGSIVSPSRECGLSALRPTFGRVSRYGAMTLSWTRDRIGPMCRTIEDCAMVFNTIHGVDEKDPSTLMTPFQFERSIKLASLRIGVDPGAPKAFVDKLRELGANPKPIGPRPQLGGGGGGGGGGAAGRGAAGAAGTPAAAGGRGGRGGGGGGGAGESAAAFDFYVQMKAKELGVDLDSLVAAGRGGAGRGGAAADSAAGRGGRGGGRGAGGIPGDPTPIASLTSRAGGRTALALDFVQAQRRQHILMVRMAEFLKDWDMYVPSETNGDVGLHAQTGHPCVVVPYKFEAPTTPVNGAVMGPGVDSAGVAGGPGIQYNPKPICAVIAGNLFNDDKILSVAHQFQINTDIHTRHPSLR